MIELVIRRIKPYHLNRFDKCVSDKLKIGGVMSDEEVMKLLLMIAYDAAHIAMNDIVIGDVKTGPIEQLQEALNKMILIKERMEEEEDVFDSFDIDNKIAN